MTNQINIAEYIDNTLLKPDATDDAIRRLCEETRAYSFKAVCVNSCHAGLCSEILSGSGITVCSVIGFPLGACTSETKAFEAGDAIRHGAGEIDMVINIGALKSGRDSDVRDDIALVAEACKGRALLKVIIETCLLTEDEKKRAVLAAVEAGADFVKTSTGFSSGGATVEDIRLMRSLVGDRLGVKAAGGVRSRADAMRMIEAGATRIGTSNGVKILEGESVDGGY